MPLSVFVLKGLTDLYAEAGMREVVRQTKTVSVSKASSLMIKIQQTRPIFQLLKIYYNYFV